MYSGVLPYVEPNDEYYPPITDPSHPLYPGQWDKRAMYVPQAQDVTRGSATARVGIIGGAVYPHSEFSGRFNVYNACRDSNEVFGYSQHATAVAGVALATGNNLAGVAGIDWNAQIWSINDTRPREEGCPNGDPIQQGLRWAADNGFSAVLVDYNLLNATTLRDAVSYATSRGVVVVNAAGNCNQVVDGVNPQTCPFSGGEDFDCPACYADTLGVISVGSAGWRSTFDWPAYDLRIKRSDSNYGSRVTLYAPGHDLPTTDSSCSTCYTRTGATSGAAPEALGVVALVKALVPSMNGTQMQALLRRTAGKGDPAFGGGLLNAAAGTCQRL